MLKANSNSLPVHAWMWSNTHVESLPCSIFLFYKKTKRNRYKMQPFAATLLDSVALLNQSLHDKKGFAEMCRFQELDSIGNFFALFQRNECFRHSISFTVFLCLANLVILLFGLVGNIVVIYVVVVKQKLKTASSIFILNLAVADLMVILCCIPATLVSNLFIPWVLGEPMCKITTYNQGVSVFSSVYSLVAISFDRFRAIHQSLGVTPNISVKQSYRIVCVVWILGLFIALPWAFVFKVMQLNPYNEEYSNLQLLDHPTLPFCQEVWDTKTHETVYFVVIHVFVCFILPFGLITACNIVMWRSMLSSGASSQTQSDYGFPNLNRSGIQETQRRRKLRVLKMFTGLTFVFFFCWIPLYLLQGRVKFFYTENYKGSEFEQWLVSILMPVAQLLGSCNSCVNPVLYALLNQTFRESFKQIYVCRFCPFFQSRTVSPSNPDEQNELPVIVPVNFSPRNRH